MNTKRVREIELDFVRVISMVMIIICHIFAEAGMKWGEYFNVGVMIFMFMSGYLSYRAEYGKKWIAGRMIRILPEYYIFLVIYLIVTLTFLHAEISIKQVLVNTLILQGLFTDSGLPNILHLWFITYILICYFLTPFAVRTMKKADWKKLILIAVICQVFVISLRFIGVKIVFSRFLAYFLGLYLAIVEGKRETRNEEKSIRYKKIVSRIYIPILTMNMIRFAIELSGLQERLPGAVDMALGFAWQWAHMFLGIFLFYVLWLLGHQLVRYMSKTYRTVIFALSSTSYCVYVVHQVFVYHDYAVTRYISPYPMGLIIAVLCIAVSTCILYYLSNGFRVLIKKG